MASIRLHERHLRIFFDTSPLSHADYHYLWLRHQCDGDRHPHTRERTVCSSQFGAALAPLSAHISEDGATLWITWNEAGSLGALPHRSQYDLQWLRTHAYALNREDVLPPPQALEPILVNAAGWTRAQCVEVMREKVRDWGVVVVRGFGLDTEGLIEGLEEADLVLRETHFGRIEDLRPDNTTNQNTDQLGYTFDAVEPHTDQPFIEAPPRYQLLHCIRAATHGGENAVVDGLQAARYLQAHHAHAFQLLTETPIQFDRRQQAFRSVQSHPILSFSAAGAFQIRYSYFTMAPFQLPFERLEEWYDAYHLFARLVRAPAHQYRFLLEPGELVFYDNHRMLHARTAFSGPRWLRGVYFDPVTESRKAVIHNGQG